MGYRWLVYCTIFEYSSGLAATRLANLNGLQLRPILVPIKGVLQGVTVLEVDDNKW
jgi:hypothetical protein